MSRGSETRERILAVAARLFHEHGFCATGVAAILHEAGANSGSLYHFFPGKEELLIGVLEKYVESQLPRLLDAAEAETEDPVGRVFALLDSYRSGLLVSDCTRGCPVGNLALEVGDDRPRLRALIDQYFAGWVAGVEDWLVQAGDRLPRSADRAALARLVLSAMEGGVMQARSERSLAAYDSSVDQLRQYLELLEERARQVPSMTGETGAGRRKVPSPADSSPPADGEGQRQWRAW